MKTRIFRAVVCLLLVCCLVVNISPIKAEAFLLESYLAYGAVAAMVLMSTGVVFHAATDPQLYALGQSFYNSMYQWGTEAKKLDEVEDFFQGLRVYSAPDDDDDDIETLHDRKINLARGILAGMTAWVASIIFDLEQIKSEEALPSGYAYFNEYVFPELPDSIPETYPYLTIRSPGSVILIASDLPLAYNGEHGIANPWDDTLHYVSFLLSDDRTKWEFVNTAQQLGPQNTLSYPTSYVNFLWANYDIFHKFEFPFHLHLAASSPTPIKMVDFDPSAYVGDIPDKVLGGEISPEEIPMPQYIDYELFFNYGANLGQAISNISQGLSSGEITFEDYKTMIGYDPFPEVVPDPIEPSEDPSEATDPSEDTEVDPAPSIGSDDLDSPMGDVSGTTFFDKLLAVVTEPFKWIWSKIETFFTTALKPELWLDSLPEIFAQPFRWIWEKIETFFEPLLNPSAQKAPFEWIWGKIEPIPGQVTEAIFNAADRVEASVNRLVFPEEDYLTDKVDALRSEFAFADSIVRTAQAMQTGLAGVTTEPPVIYIDLGATRGSYNIGGTVPFLDLRWYAEYKPTVDTMISAFLWICFVWRMLLKLPGIISGMPGDFMMASAHTMGLNDLLPSRSAEYEQLRIERRESIRKGRKISDK